MDSLAYSGINTSVRIMEQSLLTKDDLDTLLKASSLTQALEFLSKFNYSFDIEKVVETKDFESFLMASLQKDYETLYAVIPQKELLDIFSSRYVFHNLKVLLKEKFTQQAFKELYIPIGHYSMETLTSIVQSADLPHVPALLTDAVEDVSTYFEQFHQLESADILMDQYYFKFIRSIAEQLDNSTVTNIVNSLIDIENVATLVRARRKDASRSFLQTVLSDSGTVSTQALIDTSSDKNWEQVAALFAHATYKDAMSGILTEDVIDVFKLDLLKDELIFEQLKDAVFEAFGPMPSLAYIHAKEMEVSNLRLILVGLDNGFETEQLQERMRPVYYGS